MEMRLQRGEIVNETQHGDLSIDGEPFCVTLENDALKIPAGRYQVEITESPRVVEGSLWSPRSENTLPLVCDVPGRDGIRFHAANHSYQLEGCIAPGKARDGDSITQSRPALIALMAKIDAAEGAWLTVEDA
jgi:hypothetical protein